MIPMAMLWVIRFLIVLPNSDDSQALRLAERIRLAVSSEPFRFHNVELTVTVSQGVTTWNEPFPIPVEQLIQAADRGLYIVKNRGRNGVEHVPFDYQVNETDSSIFVSPITCES